ncbi:MAG: GHKL domain-containing protein [Lachnospiraceae bacterium]|nr:GHKL domain-containing protein [Lachnospiraceae bacterium]
MELITRILGNYTRETFSLVLTFLESQLCISLFCYRLEKRRHFPLRALIGVLEGSVLCFLLAILYTEIPTLGVRVLCYLIIGLLNFLFISFCWKSTIEEWLMNVCCGQAAYQIGNKLYPLIQNLRGIDDKQTLSLIRPGVQDVLWWEWLIFFGLRIGIYLLLAFIFAPEGSILSNRRTRKNIVILSVSTVAFINVLVCISRVYESESMPMNILMKAACIFIGFFVLWIGSGIFTQSEQERQIDVMHQLMHQEKTQFENVKLNINAINTKIHDLKHILNRVEGKLSETEVRDLKRALEFYDSNIQTGNNILDVILCEKNLVCQERGITLSCMADGRGFSFLSPAQTYTLFGNIIDNAIEAASRLDDPAEKLIDLACGTRGSACVIEASNYFSGTLNIRDGLPVTSKEDAHLHGYGTRSIRYIVEQYGGNMDIRAEGNIFFLSVTFPGRGEAAAA